MLILLITNIIIIMFSGCSCGNTAHITGGVKPKQAMVEVHISSIQRREVTSPNHCLQLL